SHAQSVDSKVQLHAIYLPQFTVQQATDSNAEALGLRWMLSDYDFMPLEFGVHAYAGYGGVARVSFGFNLVYRFAEWKSHHFKIGLGLSKIDLEDIDTNKEEFGPHVGDVRFTSWGNEFKP